MITKIVLPLFVAFIQISQTEANVLATPYRSRVYESCGCKTTASPPITFVRTGKPCGYPRKPDSASSETKPRNVCSCAKFKDYFLAGDSGCSTCKSNKHLPPPLPPRTCSKEITKVLQRPTCPPPRTKTCIIQNKTISKPSESGAKNRGSCNSNVNLLMDMNREFSRRLCRSQSLGTNDQVSAEKRYSCFKKNDNEFPRPSRIPSSLLFGKRQQSACSKELRKLFEKPPPKVPQPCSPCCSGNKHISNQPYRTRQSVECSGIAKAGIKVVPAQDCDEYKNKLQEECDEFKRFLDSVEMRSSKLTAKTLTCQNF